MSKTSLLSMYSAIRWIIRNTQPTTSHLTPSISLQLITPDCSLWTSRPEDCPFPDPYWAFYWPGGQGLTRYILEHPSIIQGKHVLDFGCGCGASIIAALRAGARSVLANDIDQFALLATSINLRRNNLHHTRITCTTDNLVGSDLFAKYQNINVILVGDLLYESGISHQLLQWLTKLQQENTDLSIYIGDPGRHIIQEMNPKDSRLLHLKRYALPTNITSQHYGFSSTNVYRLNINNSISS